MPVSEKVEGFGTEPSLTITDFPDLFTPVTTRRPGAGNPLGLFIVVSPLRIGKEKVKHSTWLMHAVERLLL
jgi:hypothetical protein